MTNSLQDKTKALKDLPFESIVSEAMDDGERYHAKVMKDHVLDKLENKLKKAITERSNIILFLLKDEIYDQKKPKPTNQSKAISQTVQALNDLPWIAHANFDENYYGGTIRIFIQDPHTKKKIFPDDGYGDGFYAQEPKAIEEQPKPIAIAPPKKTFAQRIGLRRIETEIIEEAPIEVEQQPSEPTLTELFQTHLQNTKEASKKISGLNIDFLEMDQLISKIDALLNTDWDEQVFGSNESSFRSALFHLKTLSATFEEHAKILSVVNKNPETEPQTLPNERLEELQHNFTTVTKTVDNALKRAINARLERAGIGITVQEARLQLQKMEDLGLTIIEDAITVTIN